MATICHGQLVGALVDTGGDACLVWTGDDLWKLAFLLILAFDYGLDDAGVVGAEVHEAVGDARLPDGLEEGE